MHAYPINNNGSSNNLPCYPPDSHQCDNAIYWRTGSTSNQFSNPNDRLLTAINLSY